MGTPFLFVSCVLGGWKHCYWQGNGDKTMEMTCELCWPRAVTSLAVHVGGKALGKYQEDIATLGTTSFAKSSGQTWAVTSTGFVTGASFQSNVTSISQVSGTVDPVLYETARTSPGSLRYLATQLRNGNYTVVLSFAEIIYLRDDTLARRLFDIYLQVNPHQPNPCSTIHVPEMQEKRYSMLLEDVAETPINYTHGIYAGSIGKEGFEHTANCRRIVHST